jgi:transposase
MVAVAITRGDHTAAELRRLAAASGRDAKAARRMLAIALALDGVSRADAARLCGMDRQTLRDWIHRYNAAGIAGLSDRREGRGRKPSLTPEQAAEVAALVRAGPDLAEHGVVRWRRADLARVIEQRFGVRLDERTVGRLLRRLGCQRLSVRPRHPRADPKAQAAHKKTSPRRLPPPSPSARAASRSSSGGKMRLESARRAH